MGSDSKETLLTRREAAERAGVHYNTIRLWERQGRVSPRRVMHGQQEEVRIPESDIERVIKERVAEMNKRGPEIVESLERIGVLEAENATLRERLEASEAERRQLLQAILERVGSKEGR